MTQTKAQHQASAGSYLTAATGAGYTDPIDKLRAAIAAAQLAATTNQSANVSIAEGLLSEIENRSTVSLPPGELAYVHALLATQTT
jgi:hypothetical protein